jgi:hypothetical protein
MTALNFVIQGVAGRREANVRITNSCQIPIARARRYGLVIAAAIAISLLFVSPASAERGIVGTYQFERESCANKPEEVTCNNEPGDLADASSAAVNANGAGGGAPGELTVTEESQFFSTHSGPRVQQFDSSGDFLRLWGRGVVASGPNNADETQAVMVAASSGSFTLSFASSSTSAIPFDAPASAVEAALNGLGSLKVEVTGGPGNANGSDPYLVAFTGGSGGIDQPLIQADGASLAGGSGVNVYTTNNGDVGFEICSPQEGDVCKVGTFSFSDGALGGTLSAPRDIATDPATGDLYIPSLLRINQFSATGEFKRAFGQDAVAQGPGDSGHDETQELTIRATGGTFPLTFPFGLNGATTDDLPYNASAAEVEAALNGLSSIGGVGGRVTVTGGPGDATGAHPYTVEFGGALGGDDVGDIASSAGALSGSGKGAKAMTIDDGGAYEICTVEDACKIGSGTSSSQHGIDVEPNGIDVVPPGAPNAGNVLSSGGSRIQEFSPNGELIRAFGFDTVASGPDQVAAPDEQQKLTIEATGGKFAAYFNGKSTGLELGANFTEGSTTVVLRETTQGLEVGQGVASENLPPGTTIIAVGPGQTVTVSQPAIHTQDNSSIRARSIPYDATAAELEAAINSLPTIGDVGGSVTVSGGPGNATGSSPYIVTFGGTLSGDDVPPVLLETTGTLTGTVSAETQVEGGAFEVCEPSAGDVCDQGSRGTRTGQFKAPKAVAEDTTGAIYTSEASRIQKFTPQAGTPSLSPSVFQAGEFRDVAMGSGDQLFALKLFEAGDATCQGGKPSPIEQRIQEFTGTGTLVETSTPCTKVGDDTEQNLTVNRGSSNPYVAYKGDTSKESHGPSVAIFGFPGSPPDVSLNSINEITSSGGGVSGTVDPNGPGAGYPKSSATTYRVEYKRSADSQWTAFTPNIPVGAGDDPIPFQVGLSDLAPNTPFDVKVVAEKAFVPNGTVSKTVSFTTEPAAPEVLSEWATDLQVTSATLHARVNPLGTPTSYHFEYGSTPAYGSETPETDMGDSLDPTAIAESVEDLPVDTTTHFRVVATNAVGTTNGPDQSFSFSPPACPNQTIRQQTKTAYLPDCRAYELVSPEDAGGTVLFTGGPQSAYATNPPRLAFVGQFGEIPGAGTPINTSGDLYASTRGAAGWQTRYIGPPPEQAGCAGGRPIVDGAGLPTTIQNDVFTDPGLNRFLDWNLGNPAECIWGAFGKSIRMGDLNTAAIGSNAPYVWNAEGQLLDRWPTSAGDMAGAEENFACPQDKNKVPFPTGWTSQVSVAYGCSTHVTASGDLSHFVFATASGLFGQGGISTAPGSAYDNDTANNTLTLISKQANGEPIQQEPLPNGGPEELIQFPAVSADGSHILMGTARRTQCKQVEYPDTYKTICPLISQPTRLYMRVDDAVTYDVSAGAAVKYLDATEDGSKVYFSSAEPLTADDTDTSVDLFMWDENGGAPKIVRVSAGDVPSGNGDNCVSTWAEKCGAEPYSDVSISKAVANRGGLGGWSTAIPDPNPGYTDNGVAAKSGDIYFYSPEQLDGARGAPGFVNLYVYRKGEARFVARLDDDPYCIESTTDPNIGPVRYGVCSDGSVGRLQVTPDGRFAAFITTTNLTGFDNDGFAEMYRYDAESEEIICVSCDPTNAAPVADVRASMGGRFITDDGRVFFDTADPLDPRDTNQARDVYEYVDGKPQLITTGTGPQSSEASDKLTAESVSGLYGVSADGVDVYFGTIETLVGQDRNGGGQLRFYDARTNGGFSFVPLPAPCAAADECHGEASGAPQPLAMGTTAALIGGNAASPKKKAHKAKKKHRKHRHRKASTRRGGVK